MHADLALRLRPRPMFEAADLGVRLVQAHAASVWRCWLPLYAVVAALALATQEIAAWLPWTLLLLLKPWLARTLLFVLSRAVFGQATTFGELWRAQRQAWWQRLVSTLTLRRLSPWRAYTQAAEQLEGLAGRALRARKRQLLRGQQGRAMAMQAAFWHAESALAIGIVVLGFWFVPGGEASSLLQWFRELGTAQQFVLNAAYALAVAFVEPFHVGAGFAMYLNRRVELEAWDIEQEFRHAFAG